MSEEKRRILIADDLEYIRNMLKDTIKFHLDDSKNRFIIDVASDGEEALDYILKHNKLEILLTDIRMPPKNEGGVYLLTKLHTDPLYESKLPRFIGII